MSDEKMSVEEIREMAITLKRNTAKGQVWEQALTTLLVELCDRLADESAKLVDETEKLKGAVAAGIRRLTEAMSATSATETPSVNPTEAPTTTEATAAAEIAALPPEMRPKAGPAKAPEAPPTDDIAAHVAQIHGAAKVPKAR